METSASISARRNVDPEHHAQQTLTWEVMTGLYYEMALGSRAQRTYQDNSVLAFSLLSY